MDAPQYTVSDHKNREVFLSQLDNFTPNERSLFHKLCEMWEPLIPITPLLREASKSIPNCDTELTRLMKKLQQQGIGIVKTKIVNEERKPEGIILCEVKSKQFYIHLLEEEIISVIINPSLDLPSTISLNEKNIEIPSIFISQSTFAQAFEQSEDTILSIYLNESLTLIVPRSSLNTVFNIHLRKIREHFQTESLVDVIAQLMNKRLLDFRKSISESDPLFWFELGKICSENRRNLENQQKSRVPASFFTLLIFTQHYASAQLTLEHKKMELDKGKREDIQQITQLVKDHDDFVLSKQEFEYYIHSMKDKYEDSFSDFQKELLNTVLNPRESRVMPEILLINGSYIHKENIKGFFQRGIEVLSQELYIHYLKKMKAYIKNPIRHTVYAFNSVDSFENDIIHEVMQRNEIMSYLLENPELVAEAILHSNQKSGRLKSIEEMKSSISKYFYAEKVQFREFQVLFDLDISVIYQRAFNSLGIFRQLILKLMGNHERYAKLYIQQTRILQDRIEQSENLNTDQTSPREGVHSIHESTQDQTRAVRDLPHSINRSIDRSSKRTSEHERANMRSRSRSSARDKAQKSMAHQRRARKEKKHHYSAKEKERAWSDFAQRVKE